MSEALTPGAPATPAPPPAGETWRDALQDRTGVAAIRAALLNAPSRGGPSRFGRVLAALIGLQVLTGAALLTGYSPGAASAWESVLYFEERVPLGTFVRGLHAFGASAVVVLLAAHVVLAGLKRAYRAPFEAAWVSGLLVAPVLLGFALTGYLLPWDQKGYWATRVATGIAAGTPLIGPTVERVLQGGPEVGTLTLTRFSALHTAILPWALAIALSIHVALVRRAAARVPSESRPWWPGRGPGDVALAVGVIIAVALLATRGAGLDAPADPAVDYPARPEWFFSPLRQLLKTVPEPWGSVFLPGLLATLVLALPWIDRADRPRPRLARAIILGPLLGALLLGLQSAMQDAADGEYRDARAAASEDAALARALAREGVPPGGAAELLRRHPPRWGKAQFVQRCNGCHALDGRGGEVAPTTSGLMPGPDLTGYLSPGWISSVIKDPRAKHLFGRTGIDGMEPLAAEHLPTLPALTAFVRAQDPEVARGLDPALVKAGEDAYYELECNGCHELKPGAIGAGPNLAGYGTPAWLRGFLRDPGRVDLYCTDNHMPACDPQDVPDDALDALVTYLRELDPARRR